MGIGYFLGRTRKMRWAMGLAGAAMSKRSTGLAGELLERGTSTLGGTKELTKITDTVRGELLGAVRSAAVTAASNRLDALNDRLQSPVPTEDEDEDEDGGGRGRPAATEEDTEPEPNAADETADETPDEEEAEEPAPRPRARRTTATKSSRSGTRTSTRSSDSGESGTTASRRRRAGADTDKAPVRRTRR
ncbi:hypothetical protein ACWDO0_08615 [Nocardia rhamnosiphila]|uniref:hypothetical protein n=1 Tax=Nocardia rhamnosiphila TaxID=426716 RepID=UPI000A7C0EB0|nr:hypothetical protein [Nocardia rhamnosiphila]